MKIVKLDKNNIKLVAQLRIEFYNYIEKELKYYPMTTNFDLKFHLSQLHKYMKRKETIVLVGKEGDEIMAYIIGYAFIDDYDNEKYGYLDEIFIKPEFRGKRLISSLHTVLTNELAKFNIKGIYTDVSTKNLGSLKAHKRIGYKLLDTTEILFKKR